MSNATPLADRQAAHLAQLSGVRGVTNPRRMGTITAVDLQVGDGGYLSDLGPRLSRFFTRRDLLLRPLGNTVYVMPPYCIDDPDLDAIYTAIAEACATLL